MKSHAKNSDERSVYDITAPCVIMRFSDNQTNVQTVHTFCESEPRGENNSKNHGKLARVKLKCLEEGPVTMRVQWVHLTHRLAE